MLLARLLLPLLVLLVALSPAHAAYPVKVVGVDDDLRANIEAYIGPREETDRMSWRALSRHVQEQAIAALQVLGYYRPVISISRTDARGDSGGTCLVTVDPGPPVRIAGVDVQLTDQAERPVLQAWIDENRPQRGAVFHHGQYEAFKTGLMQQALMRGYFKAAWQVQEVRVDIDALTADIHLALASGPRYRVGEVTINGEGIDHGLVARFPRFRSGDGYDATKIAELHRDLVRTSWFESVRIRAEPEEAVDLAVPVSVDYTMRKRNRIGIGAGASTDVGPRLQLQWEKPWLNSRGHSLSSYAEVSGVRSQVEASYLVPLTDPVTSQLAWTYGLQYEDLNDYSYWLTTAGIEHRKRLPSEWRVIRALELEQETDDFITFETRTTLLMPGVTFTRTDADGAPLITRGWRVTSEIKFAADALGSDADLVRATADGKAIYSLGERTRTIMRAGGGALWTPDLLDIPVSQRFFAGGDQSVRGYDYESISPLNAAGERIGGRYVATASLELDYRFTDRWMVAAFVDQGSVFDDAAPADVFTGAGAGVRWLSPIGPLRLDFAWGISLDDPAFNVHFYMGPEL